MQPESPADTTVQRAIDAWIRKLVDFSQRNNLLYFRDLKAGTLDCDAMDPVQRDRLLAGEAVMLGKLLPPASKEDADRRAKSMLTVWRKALSNMEERGIQTLFLAHGMATWQDDRVRPGSGEVTRPPMSPVLLYPVAVERSGRDGQTFSLRIAGEPQVNLVLLLALREWAGVDIEAEPLLESETGVIEPAVVFEKLREAAPSLRGFDVLPRWVLGNFAFQKTALVADLRDHPDRFIGHPLVRRLAGLSPTDVAEAVEGDPSNSLAASATTDLDRIDPGKEFLVLDADSSQHQVILKALAGANGVIQGPPGTGKSQTIVNLIASFSAQGKRVLFVAEKRAALEVVLQRLEALGLGHLALDLHGADVSRKTVMERVATALSTIRESVPVADEAIHGPFVERRDRLIAHADRMHARVGGTGMTPFEIIGELTTLPAGLETETRWRGSELAALSPDRRARVLDILEELGAHPGLFLRDPSHAWAAFAVADGAAALRATDTVDELRRSSLPTLTDAYRNLALEVGLPPRHAFAAIREAAAASLGWVDLDAAYGRQLFTQDLDRLETDLAAVEKPGIGGIFGRLFGGSFKAAKRTLSSMRATPGDARLLLADVRAAQAAHNRWRALTTIAPPPEPTRALTAALAEFDAKVAALTSTSLTSVVLPLETPAFDEWLASLQSQRGDAPRMAAVVQLQHELLALGVPAFSAELRHRQASPATWQTLFRHAHSTSAWEAACLAEPGLAGFDGRYHDAIADAFCDLDMKRLKVAADRVRRAHAERAIATMNRFPEQDALVRRESQKKTRHLPLRQLVGRAPDVLTALSPCWMASPLSVSQLLDIERRTFDVVIFDEASQVLPEDAVCSLVRAEYAVVAGDSRQLPPTTFFAASQDEGEVDDEDETAGFESLLDQMMAIVPEPWLLEWHYRSRDERLIAFSNAEVYGGRLVTFPGAGVVSPVRHEFVQASDADAESSAAEVRRVVELILEHAATNPKQSLGVIAMGIKHADRLQAALDAELARRGDESGFFATGTREPFFIKNLERVQGDERDAIILSVGYGKDASGRLPFRFGPLLLQGGERRLNVAITRARSSLTLVSSFTYFDMDPDRCHGRRGLELLRGYLEYAAAGASRAPDAGKPSRGVTSAMAAALREAGLDVEERVGASKYRIDLAVRERDADGGGLAIETDGDAYHSGASARDRDRLRPQQLERLGWTFHRAWAADWLRDPAAETARALAAINGDLPATASPAPGQLAIAPLLSPTTSERGPRPRIGRRDSIDDYTPRELVTLVAWIQSDGRLRTDEELMTLTRQELGFERRGSRIDAALREAIAWVRQMKP